MRLLAVVACVVALNGPVRRPRAAMRRPAAAAKPPEPASGQGAFDGDVLFVSNVDFDTTADELRSAFEERCAVASVAVPRDGAGRGRGFAFVRVGGGVEATLVRGSIVVAGRPLTVKRNAAPRPPRPRRGAAPAPAPSPAASPEATAQRRARQRLVNDALVASRTAADIFSLYEEHGAHFGAVNFATALHRLGKACAAAANADEGDEADALLRGAAAHLSLRFREWGPREVSNVCWGLAQLTPWRFHVASRGKAAGDAGDKRAAVVDARDAVVAALAKVTLLRISDFQPQALASTAHSLAKLRRGDAEARQRSGAPYKDGVYAPVFSALARRGADCVGAFSAQGLSNTAWALAAARCGGADEALLMDAIIISARARVGEFKAQELANLVWACASWPAGDVAANARRAALLDAVAAAAAARADEFDAHALSNTVWAFATLRHGAPHLFGALASKAARDVCGFTPQALANTVWAYAVSAPAAPPPRRAVVDGFSAPWDHFPPAVRLKRAPAVCAESVDNLFAAVSREATARMQLQLRDGAAAPQLFKPREVASLAWAFAKTRAGRDDDDGAGDDSMRRRSAPEKRPRDDTALFDAVSGVVAANVGDFEAHELANVAWALARHLGRAEIGPTRASPDVEKCLEALAERSLPILGSFSAQGLANVAWALSLASWYPAGARRGAQMALFDALAVEAAGRVSEFGPQGLANVAWAYANLVEDDAFVSSPGGTAPRAGAHVVLLFERVAAAAPPLIVSGAFKPQELSNLAWAFAKLRVRAPRLLDVIARACILERAALKPQALANLAWAYATLGGTAPMTYHERALLDAVGDECARGAKRLNAQQLSNVAWAFTRARVQPPGLFDALAREAAVKVDALTPQALTVVASAFAPFWAGAPDGTDAAAAARLTLFSAIARAVATKAAQFSPRGLANVAAAFAPALPHMRRLPLEIFRAVANESQRRLGGFNPQNLASLALAFSALTLAADDAPAPDRANAHALADGVLCAAAAAAAGKADAFTACELATFAYAVARAELRIDGAVADFYAAAADSALRRDVGDFSPQAAARLLHAAAFYVEQAAAVDSAGAATPEAAWLRLQARLRAAAAAHAAAAPGAAAAPDARPQQPPRPLQTQHAVSDALRRIGWAHEFEHVTAEGISLDMAQPAERLAVEVDGPTHYEDGGANSTRYAAGPRGFSARVLDGKSNCKERLLRGLAWRLVRVPYFEWDALYHASDQEAYLRRKLRLVEPPLAAPAARLDPRADGPQSRKTRANHNTTALLV